MADAKIEDKAPLEETSGLHVTVTDFCRQRLGHDKRPELLNAFHRDERDRGRVKDSSEAFAERLETFANRLA